jgi:hypothetical protein
MENIRTIAVIGALKKEIFNTQRIIRALPPLLFDNKEALTNIHEKFLWRKIVMVDVEKWICPALVKQILLFFWFCVNDAAVVERIKELQQKLLWK